MSTIPGIFHEGEKVRAYDSQCGIWMYALIVEIISNYKAKLQWFFRYV
jgi:hypothetical protein